VNKVSVEVPIMGESITTGTIAEWLVASGDFVDADQVVANIETDKVTVEVRVPQAGQIMELFAEDGAEVEVGNPLFSMDTNAIGESSAPVAKEEVAAPTPAAAAPTKASAPAPTKAAAPPTPTVSAPSSGSTDNRGETRVKMTRMRVRIAQRLKESQNTAAMLTTFQEVDMGPLIAMRNKYKEEFLKIHGVKLGFMSAFVRASTTALMELPAVNGVIDDETNEIVYRNYVDVSVAVASPTGLVVPVLRNTEEMTFADVEKTIGMYGQKAKEGVLALEDMAGGTFTISNGGVFGSLFGTPIINPPQSAILGMHATKMRPMVMADGSIEARPMMYLALTYDHRLIDGREAVTFLKSVQNKIEDPSRLLLEL
jgi:2-oxoglutarate dehydrogenase E2 component (dihydrolipoamide succinyltransferase)